MKKLSVIRFKPNPEHYDEFTRTLREFLDQRTRERVLFESILGTQCWRSEGCSRPFGSF